MPGTVLGKKSDVPVQEVRGNVGFVTMSFAHMGPWRVQAKQQMQQMGPCEFATALHEEMLEQQLSLERSCFHQ